MEEGTCGCRKFGSVLISDPVGRSGGTRCSTKTRTGDRSARELASLACPRIRGRASRRDRDRWRGALGYAARWYSVDEPAEQVTTADPADVDHVADCLPVDGPQGAERRALLERAVRPVLVVVRV